MYCMIPFISSSKIVKVICGVRSKDRLTTGEQRVTTGRGHKWGFQSVLFLDLGGGYISIFA